MTGDRISHIHCSIIMEYTSAHGISLATPRDRENGILSPSPRAQYKEPTSARGPRKSSRAQEKGL